MWKPAFPSSQAGARLRAERGSTALGVKEKPLVSRRKGLGVPGQSRPPVTGPSLLAHRPASPASRMRLLETTAWLLWSRPSPYRAALGLRRCVRAGPSPGEPQLTGS